MNKIKLMQKSNHESKHFAFKAQREQLGFTLIELMIVVAIIGVLASVVYPSYVSFITSSNRSEGQGELLRYANLQEQYFIDHRTYGEDLTDLGKATATIITEHGHYKISVNDADTAVFVLNAEAQGAQATNDSDCSPLTINQVGVKGPADCWN